MMKYIIEVEQIPNTSLYKAKGFNTLVFDQTGLDKLKPYLPQPAAEFKVGDIITTRHGVIQYRVMGYSNQGKLNVINLSTNSYTTLPVANVRHLEEGEPLCVEN